MGNVNLGVFISGIIVVIGIYSILTLSLNLKFGITGLIDLGIVGYFAVGAYAFVLVTAPHPTDANAYTIGLGLPLWVGLIVAPLVSGLVALLVGMPALRLSGEYLAIATYAFAEVVRAVATNEEWLTNGVVGFNNLHKPFRGQFASGNVYQYFYMVLVLVALLLIFLALSRLHWGPFGRALRAVRENEEVALSVGKNITRLRMKSFVLGGMISGVAACFYVTYASLIVPTMFVSEVTWTVWIALVIGGTGNYKGAVLGTAVLVTAQELTRFFQASADLAPMLAASRFIAMGLILILIIRFRPKGILPERHSVDPPFSPALARSMDAGAGGDGRVKE